MYQRYLASLTLIVIAVLVISCGSVAPAGSSEDDVSIAQSEEIAQSAETTPPTSVPTREMQTDTPTPIREPTATSTDIPNTVAPPTAAPLSQCNVSTTLLNLRTGPGIQFEIVDQMPNGTVFEALGRIPDASWIFGASPQSMGWASAKYMTCNFDILQLPIEALLPIDAPPTSTSNPTATIRPVPAASETPTPLSTPSETPIPTPSPTPTSTPTPIPQPRICLSSNRIIDFEGVEEGQRDRAEIIVENCGSKLLVLYDVYFVPRLNTDVFTVKDKDRNPMDVTNARLPKEEACYMIVWFAPPDQGDFAANLNIDTNASNAVAGLTVVSLKGTGLPPKDFAHYPGNPLSVTVPACSELNQ